MKYRLNYDWKGFDKGHIFTADYEGYIAQGLLSVNPDCVDLLVLSGALTEVTEEKVELPEEIKDDYLPLLSGSGLTNYGADTLIRTYNSLIRYLRSKEI